MSSGSLYNRQASLVIAPVSGLPGKELRGLRIAFEVKKTSNSSANTATIKVWNMSSSTRNGIVKKKMALILRAGYGDETTKLPLLASGVVLRVEHSPQPPDVVTEIEIRDGGLGLDESKVRRSYPKGTVVMSMVRDLLATMPDVTIGALVAESLSVVTKHKRCFSGSSRTALDKLATAYGFEWSVQDGVAQVLDRTGSTGQQVTATILSSSTGLIGSPTKTQAGCKAISLLMPSVVPGGFIRTVSDFCAGYFKALTVEHKGDTFDGDWQTETEAKAIGKWVGPGKASK